MGLFSDIYNTVARFFRPQDEQEEGASKAVAANRLKLVLMQDRTNLTPKILEQMRGELIDLLSKYLEMDKELLELNFEQEGDQVALMLSIPVIRAKDEDEIEEAIKASREENSEEISQNKSINRRKCHQTRRRDNIRTPNKERKYGIKSAFRQKSLYLLRYLHAEYFKCGKNHAANRQRENRYTGKALQYKLQSRNGNDIYKIE